MTQQEWNSTVDCLKIRRFHNRSFDVGQLIGELYEELRILEAEYGPFMHDRFNLYERQLNILRLEADRLRTYGMDAAKLVERIAKGRLEVKED